MENTISAQNPARYAPLPAYKRISWSAVFAGVLVAIVSQMLLTLLGLGIGLGTIDAVEEQNPTAGLGIGSAIWYILSSLISLFLGGWIAGRLASAPRLFDGIIHGVLTWCVATLLTIYFLTTTLGSLIGGAGRLVGGLVRTAGSAAAAAAPQLGNAVQDQLKANGVDIDLSDLKGEIDQVLRETGKKQLRPEALEKQADRAVDEAKGAAETAAENPQQADETADNVLDVFIKRGKGVADQIDREAAINVVMKRTGKSRAEASQVVDNWVKTYEQARVKFEQAKKEAEVKTREVADGAASAGSKAAIFGFIGLLIGVVASGYGAKTGTESKDNTSRYDRPVGQR